MAPEMELSVRACRATALHGEAWQDKAKPGGGKLINSVSIRTIRFAIGTVDEGGLTDVTICETYHK